MYFPSWCRYRTYQCVAANYPMSKVVIEGLERKYAKVQAYQSPWYRVFTKGMVISKGSYGHGEFKNLFPRLVQILYNQCGAANYPFSWGVV